MWEPILHIEIFFTLGFHALYFIMPLGYKSLHILMQIFNNATFKAILF